METLPPYLTNLTNFLPKPSVDYSKMTDEQLLEELKKSPDFDKFVLPNSWYSKFELPEKKCMNMKEFLQESPWTKRTSYNSVGKEDIPAKPGGNRPLLPAPEVPTLTLLENNFSDNPKVQSEISNQTTTQ